MKIVSQTSEQLVLKDGGINDWLFLFNGLWALLISMLFVYMILRSVDFPSFFSDLDNVINLLPITLFVMIIGIALKYILSAFWTNVSINKSEGLLLLNRKGLFTNSRRSIEIGKIASIELTQLWKRQKRGTSVLVYQIILILKDGTMIPVGHQSKLIDVKNCGTAVSQFLDVPLNIVIPNLSKWGRKLPPYDKFPA
jgi:uncharacterized protein YacL